MLRQGLPPKYAGTCRAIAPDEAAARVAGGEKAVIRLRVPAGREVTFDDIVRGPVTFHTDVIGDPVLVRSDGMPAYNFAVVDRRCADAGDARGARRGPHFEHAATGAALRGVRLAAAGVCAPLAGDGTGSHAAVEAARRDVGRRVPREGLPAGSAGQLSRADRVVAGRGRGGAAARRARAALRPVDGGAQRRRVRRRQARVGEPPLPEDGGSRRARRTCRCRSCASARWCVGELSTPAREWLLGIVPAMAASIDRLSQVPERLQHDLLVRRRRRRWRATTFAASSSDRRPRRSSPRWPRSSQSAPRLIDRETFRAAAARVKEQTGQKGRALFHPIRVALTGEAEGPELDLLVPAIDRAADAVAGERTAAGASAAVSVRAAMRLPMLRRSRGLMPCRS